MYRRSYVYYLDVDAVFLELTGHAVGYVAVGYYHVDIGDVGDLAETSAAELRRVGQYYAVRIITLLRLASRMSVVVMPKSRSMPSTPRKSLLHDSS